MQNFMENNQNYVNIFDFKVGISCKYSSKSNSLVISYIQINRNRQSIEKYVDMLSFLLFHRNLWGRIECNQPLIIMCNVEASICLSLLAPFTFCFSHLFFYYLLKKSSETLLLRSDDSIICGVCKRWTIDTSAVM